MNKKIFKTSRRYAAADIARSNSADPYVVTAIWTTGAKGLRTEFGTAFFEELEISESAVNFERLNSGRAPFVVEHENKTQSQIGKVLRAWIENGIGYAEIQLSKSQRAADYVNDIIDGVLTSLSVGYSVEEFEETEVDANGIPTLLAKRWTPVELSLVSSPFDIGAMILRHQDSQQETETTVNSKTICGCQAQGKTRVEEEVKPAPETCDVEAIKAQAIAEYEAQKKKEQDEEDSKLAAEKQEQVELEERTASITMQVRAASLDESLVTQYLNSKQTSEEITSDIFKRLQSKQENKEIKTVSKNEQLQAALLNRIDGRAYPIDSSNPFKQVSLLKMVEAVVERTVGESDQVFAKRAISTSTLADLLANTAAKVLSKDSPEKYSYQKIAEGLSLRNTQETPIVKMSLSGLSGKTNETDDYTDTAIADTGEKIQLKDRGALFKMSYSAILNDDLGFFKTLPAKAEMLGGRDIEAQLYAMLNANPVMADTKALFHADHNNIITAGAAPSVASVDAAQQIMSAFTDESGNPMDLSIKYLVVPPALALAAHQVAGSMVAAQSSNFNPFAGQIEVIVSSRITQVGGKNVWFAVADPQEWSALCYGTLEGQGDRPEIEVEEDFNSKNLKVRVTQPSAVKAASFKGIVRTVLA